MKAVPLMLSLPLLTPANELAMPLQSSCLLTIRSWCNLLATPSTPAFAPPQLGFDESPIQSQADALLFVLSFFPSECLGQCA